MTKYLISRILRSLFSVVLVIAVIMVMIYSFLDRESIFSADPTYQKLLLNSKTEHKLQQWEKYGYLDYINFNDYIQEEVKAGRMTKEEAGNIKLGKSEEGANDNEATKAAVEAFTEKYRAEGYDVQREPGSYKPGTKKSKEGGKPLLYAAKDIPLTQRLLTYFTSIIQVDNIHKVEEITGERGLTFTWYDPAYGGEKFSPAIMGNGTNYKYLLYCDDSFPYIHQNLVKINLGVSYSVNRDKDVFNTMTDAQGPQKFSTVTYPSGVVEETADDIHSLQHVPGSKEQGLLNQKYYIDDYTGVKTAKSGMSQMGYSFSIGIVSVIGLNADNVQAVSHLASGLEGVQWVNTTESLSNVLSHYQTLVTTFLSVGLALIVLIVSVRFKKDAWRACLPTILGLLLTAAILGWLGHPVSLFTVLAGILLLGLGIDYGIFLTANPRDHRTLVAVAFAALTTFMAFGLLAFSATPALHTFGLAIAIGQCLIWILTPLWRKF